MPEAGWFLVLCCVLGCTSSPPAPLLLVVQPAAGDRWTEGRSYTIRWRANGVARVNVGLAIGGKDKGHAAFNLPAATGSLRWQVPIGFVSGFGVERSDQARVRIEDAQNPTREADSPAFTILAASADASPLRVPPPGR